VIHVGRQVADRRFPAQGLDYLHFHKVVHGDLKPANLLWDSNASTVKIADFSCSVTADSIEMIGTISTTPAFRSPESLVAGYRLNEEVCGCARLSLFVILM
jgi:serine/threonine protein kinase